MKRLLFAAARGARIQRQHYLQTASDVYQSWEDTREISTNIGSDYDYRIHPEDEHMQYGTLSSSLREKVSEFDVVSMRALLDAFQPHDLLQWQPLFDDARSFNYYAGIERQPDGLHCSVDTHRCLYMLFLAEALADEGM